MQAIHYALQVRASDSLRLAGTKTHPGGGLQTQIDAVLVDSCDGPALATAAPASPSRSVATPVSTVAPCRTESRVYLPRTPKVTFERTILRAMSMTARPAARAFAVLVLGLALRCAAPTASAPPGPSGTEVTARDSSVMSLRAVLPPVPSAHYGYAAAGVRGDARLPMDALAAVERCSVCHRDIFDQWSVSAHRYSSLDNPYYLPAFEAARAAGGVPVARWCGGCHDPGLLFAGDLDLATVDRSSERAQLGVGCLLCHSIERLHDRTGNGAYVLTGDPVPMPREPRDPAVVARHKARVMSPLLRTGEFCGACHKVGIPEGVTGDHWLRGQDDFDTWEQSAWAGNGAERYDPGVEARTCQDCHMPLVRVVQGDAAAHDGRVRSHGFAGGHTALAAWIGDRETLASEQAMLVGAVRMDLFRATARDAPAAPLDEANFIPGTDARIDVVLVNDRVGHAFPGGTSDIADTWVELTVRTAHGDVVAQSGRLVPTDPGILADDSHRLNTVPVDPHGMPALLRDVGHFRGVAYDTTLPPRSARIARYDFRVPPQGGPWTVTARLLHRRLAEPYYRFACRQALAQQGRSCPPQPVTVVASVTSVVGESTHTDPPGDSIPRWRRYYDHGRAIAESDVQEAVDDARGDLTAVVAMAPTQPEGYFELARVAMREGRTDEALRWLDAVSQHGGDTAAGYFLRAEAMGDVWRWDETVVSAQRAFELRPRSLRIMEALANGLGIAGRHADALRVIQSGLAIDPERAQLQNLQAMELEALGAPRDQTAQAREAYLRYRVHDDATGLREACARDHAACARERVPMHVHRLGVPGG